MKEKLVFASITTIGILLSFVFFVFLLIAYWAHAIHLSWLILLTVGMNFLMWLISPAITDWIQGAIYKIQRISFEDFSAAHPEVGRFILSVCEKHRIKLPALRIIQDANPTAFTYGSFPANARLVLSEGVFKYLNEEEQKAVAAHELGHIVNWDFAVMTAATTLLQVLYEIYYALLRRRRSGSGKKGDITPLIGLISYVLYLIGTYLVLYLSRTREYLADRFSAEETQNPDALSVALVKIAYGIATEADSENTQRLLVATRALGIYDFKAAGSLGSAFSQIRNNEQKEILRDLTKIFLFDLFSPWAKISEWNSTHPLTGRRIRALSEYARQIKSTSRFDFGPVEEEGRTLDQGRLYGQFFSGMMVYALPYLAIGASIFLALTGLHYYSFVIILLGIAFLVQAVYKFDHPFGDAEKMTVFELMQDPYANPLRGRYVSLEGRVIGKADAGSFFGEDVTMQDRSGCLIYLNYESPVPVVGDIFFGMDEAKKMIGQAARATGWFRRSSYQILDLERIELEDRRVIKSYTRFWEVIVGIGFVVGGCIFLFISM
jgi:Zn-dependent protease with chaperone function